MSRKSRYVTNENFDLNDKCKWNAGVYIRLSREDADKQGDSSQSVISQRKIIDKFLSDHNDIKVYEYFIDDGYSGTTMDRPGFQRMKNAFENGIINCIIIKDLSRFARNDEEAGHYIYVIFPFYNLRFISVNDRVDSFENPDSIYNLEIPFKNIMHSEYSRDLSKKVRSASDIRRRRGEFIGAFCAYGYKKDPNDFHRLIIDEEAAEIVKFIFEKYMETENFMKVAKELTGKNILTPFAYKKAHGQNIIIPQKQASPILWRTTTIKSILMNEVYLGHLIQGQRQIASYKNKKFIRKYKSQWIKVENTHEPIISQEIFDKVQQLICKNKRTPFVRSPNKHLFAGKLFCGKCGAALSVGISETTDYKYFYCRNAYLQKDFCSPKRIRNDKLEKAVLDTLNCNLRLCVDASKLLKKINTDLNISLNKQDAFIARKQSEITKLQSTKGELYEQYKEGVLTREQFINTKTEIENKIKTVQASITSISESEPVRCDLEAYPHFKNFIAHRKFSKLTRDMLDAFVDKIVVCSPTEIEIHLKFADEFATIQEYIKTHLPQVSA